MRVHVRSGGVTHAKVHSTTDGDHYTHCGEGPVGWPGCRQEFVSTAEAVTCRRCLKHDPSLGPRENRKMMQLEMDEELHRRLRSAARKEGVPMTAYIRRAIVWALEL